MNSTVLNFIFFVLLSQVVLGQNALGNFDVNKIPPAPDYSNPNHWCALPFRTDICDHFERDEDIVNDSDKLVDVFFIHPTTYSKGDNWNASVLDKGINDKTDKSTIKSQASVFSKSCRIYAPRYRQAILRSFYEIENGSKSLPLAYADVKAAFEYYLKHYNNGRPIIIASHSQGTFHAKKILKEYFDGQQLSNKLVMAYLVGYAVDIDEYKSLQACNSPTQTGGIVCWNSFKKGYIPDNYHSFFKKSICTNPISWTNDSSETNTEMDLGAKGRSLNSKIVHRVKAQVHEGILWVDVKYPVIRKWNNLHIADYNLFWYSIRNDIDRRINYYWKH